MKVLAEKHFKDGCVSIDGKNQLVILEKGQEYEMSTGKYIACLRHGAKLKPLESNVNVYGGSVASCLNCAECESWEERIEEFRSSTTITNYDCQLGYWKYLCTEDDLSFQVGFAAICDDFKER